MKLRSKILYSLSIAAIIVVFTAAQMAPTTNDTSPKKCTFEQTPTQQEPHRYGGWYCPDNLNGFPAVDIQDWNKVPVVNGRMATKEETQNGTSLILVDREKYPNAKPLDMKMPRLARFYNTHSRKDELIIIIQALNISNDSIVGFRYLNGGNGSARLHEVDLLSEDEIEQISSSRFVSLDIDINAAKAHVWDVITNRAYTKSLQPIFDPKNTFMPRSDEGPNVNFAYAKGGPITSEYAGDLFGNQYVQIDCAHGDYQYVTKFLVSENEQTKQSTLQIVCGPYKDDYQSQKTMLTEWASKVKALSEEMKD